MSHLCFVFLHHGYGIMVYYNDNLKWTFLKFNSKEYFISRLFCFIVFCNNSCQTYTSNMNCYYKHETLGVKYLNFHHILNGDIIHCTWNLVLWSLLKIFGCDHFSLRNVLVKKLANSSEQYEKPRILCKLVLESSEHFLDLLEFYLDFYLEFSTFYSLMLHRMSCNVYF